MRTIRAIVRMCRRGEVAVVLTLVLCCVQVTPHSDHSLLLLVSFDGFRHDYLELAKAAGRTTPNFDRLIASGVRATVHNSFITKTFPNHYTIATGLYEENHGIIGNNMYDPVFDEEFVNNETQGATEKWWNNGTDDWPGNPIWLQNEAGTEGNVFPRRSGVFFWPGSEAPIRGKHPTYYKPYNYTVDFDVRINTVVDWFSDDEKPINFGVLYFQEPDYVGHRHGPHSEETYDKIQELDGYLGHLIQRLESNNLFKRMNLIITSDHGMSPSEKQIDISQHINMSLIRHFGHTPCMNILPVNGSEEEVYNILKEIPNLHVFWKEDIPREYHYTYNRRIQPIVVTAAENYNICFDNKSCENARTKLLGEHGYNNTLSNMHPFFIAHGPMFRENYKSQTFNNVDIYPLMCHVLKIDPAAYDGVFQNIRHILRPPNNSTITLLTYLGVAAFSALITGVFVVSALRVHRIHTHRLLNNPRRRNVAMSNVYVDDPSDTEDGKTHLLLSDEEEIP